VAAGPKYPRQLRNAARRIRDEVERLRAETEVEARVGKWQKRLRDDVSASKRIVDVEAHVARARTEERLIRPGAAVDVEDVRYLKLRQGSAEVVAEAAQVEIQVIRAPRVKP